MINSFTGQYRFLSNFYPCRINWGTFIYPSVEHAYQAAKTLDPVTRQQIASIRTPGQAKRAGQRLILREQWDNLKVQRMLTFLRLKFSDNNLQTLLLHTGYQALVEGNNWGDNFWGVCNGSGLNHLGTLLMQVREETRHAQS